MNTDELQAMAEGRHVFSHKDGLALARELLAARAKVAAAERLAQAAAHIADLAADGWVTASDVNHKINAALAAWDAAQ